MQESMGVCGLNISRKNIQWDIRVWCGSGELEERADEVNDTAYELLDDIEAKWLKKHKPKNPNSFTEQLQLRTQTRMMAEEIVIMDVVMQFH